MDTNTISEREEGTMRMKKAAVVLVMAVAGMFSQKAVAAAAPCTDIPHADHPKATITNGEVKAVVFLPDAVNGYYRGPRFDWSGVVACATYNGHTYFGEWFRKYDPMINDAITGPAEEFRSGDTEPLYDAAPVGGLFVKPGVGVLRKTADAPYKFGFSYPIVDTGKWTVKVKGRSIVFRQDLKGPGGIAYRYEKELVLDKHGSVMTLRHSLKNMGSTVIDTSVYDHGFFMLDGKPTGVGHAVHFGFKLQPEAPMGEWADVSGNDIVYTKDLPARGGVQGYIKGFSDKASDYDFTVEDKTTKVGVQETSTLPLEKVYFWSIKNTICPEGYVHMRIEPGKTSKWEFRFRFFGPAVAAAAAM
jgi:hypothetical protein